MPGAMSGSIDAPLVEALATAYFALYPLGVEREPYRGFARDSLDTLGRAIMNAQCWSRGRIERGEILRRGRTGWGSWEWDRASGDLSASMFFCLKYLASAEIGPWLGSAFAIEDPYWRAQLMVWFVGAHDMLTGKMRQPHEFPDDMRPCIAWEYSHILSGADCGATTKATAAPFLPEANRAAAHAAVVAFFDDETYLNWLCAICEDEQLESELAELPETFAALYLG
jgi:hypothetical protein